MKKFLFFSVVLIFTLSCNQKESTPAASDGNAAAKALYEKNLVVLKASLSAFEKEDIEGWSASVADSVVWNSASYGDTVTTKAHWKEILSGYLADWDNIKLVDPDFYPGVDSTHALDGSVRYYGQWDAMHKSGVKTSVNFYGTYDFNKDGKVIFASDFFDVGGMMNAIKPK